MRDEFSLIFDVQMMHQCVWQNWITEAEMEMDGFNGQWWVDDDDGVHPHG